MVNKMLDPVADFWNREAAAFTAGDGLRRSYHLEFGETLNATLSGGVPRVDGLDENVLLRWNPFSMLIVDGSENLVRPVIGLGLRVPGIMVPVQYGLLRGVKPLLERCPPGPAL
jgi:hypothetical protein